MRKLYTAYLSYPEDIDKRIRHVYEVVSRKWPNKRSFAFVPMIPVWKVYIDDADENKLVQEVTEVAENIHGELTTKGFSMKHESGYIFLSFDTKSSKSLCDYSEHVRGAMRIKGSEDNMPYGYEPHSTILKQDPSVLKTIVNSIPDTLSAVKFRPRSLVLSRETIIDNAPTFDIVLEYAFT